MQTQTRKFIKACGYDRTRGSRGKIFCNESASVASFLLPAPLSHGRVRALCVSSCVCVRVRVRVRVHGEALVTLLSITALLCFVHVCHAERAKREQVAPYMPND